MDFYVGTCKENDESKLYFGCQDGYGFCHQQFCQGKVWAFMWYWRPLWANTFVAIIEGGEQFNEVGPSLRCVCYWVFGKNQPC